MTTATMTAPTATATARELRIADRCDRCGAQAFVLALMPPSQNRPDTTELLFCGHHGRVHTPMLAAAGATVFDYTDRINVSPSVSANAD